MSRTQEKKSLYDVLLRSVDGISIIDQSMKWDMTMLSSFTEFLYQNEEEIEKFGHASGEICASLDNYDFSTGYNFDGFKKSLEALHPLRLKLVKMGEEAKKLSSFPNRYNSKKAIETCQNLVVACSKKMSLTDVDKVSKLVDANTQKLIDLHKLFERDNEILNRINALVNADASTLKPLKAFYAELIQYVSEFPHKGQDDMEEVINRIKIAKRITDLKTDVQKSVDVIQGYYDRYNKSAVIARYAEIIHQMSTSMRLSDVRIIETQLKDVSNQIRKVIDAFEHERQEIESIYSTLRSHKAGLWKEDNERIMNSVKGILYKDNKKSSFNIGIIIAEINSAKQRRDAKISSARNQYAWLNTDETYRSEHDKIILSNISEDDYIKVINDMIIERHKWMLLLFVIPYITWKMFYYQKFE